MPSVAIKFSEFLGQLQGTAGQQQALLLHTMDVITFLPNASIAIERSKTSVLLTINAIPFVPDASIGIERSMASVPLPINVLSDAIPATPIPSAHPIWYMNDMFPTVPAPLPLEALLGC